MVVATVIDHFALLVAQVGRIWVCKYNNSSFWLCFYDYPIVQNCRLNKYSRSTVEWNKMKAKLCFPKTGGETVAAIRAQNSNKQLAEAPGPYISNEKQSQIVVEEIANSW